MRSVIFFGDIARQLHLVFIETARIALDRYRVWLCVDKSGDVGFNARDVLLSAAQPTLGAAKRVGNHT